MAGLLSSMPYLSGDSDVGLVDRLSSAMSSFAWDGGADNASAANPLESMLATMVGAWQEEHPAALRDPALKRCSQTAVLINKEPDAEEAYLEHAEADESERPPPVDATSLPQTFHVLEAPKRVRIIEEAFRGCDVARFWRVVYSDEARDLRVKYLEDGMNCWNVVVGRWATHEQLGIARLVTYEVDTHAPVGANVTRVLDYEAVERDDALTSLRYRSVCKILDATFGDHYQVETTVSVNQKGDDVSFTMDFGVFFFKSIPMWGIEKLVRSTWLAKNTAAARCFLGMARDRLAAAPIKPHRSRSLLYTKWSRSGSGDAGEAPPPPPPPKVAISGLLEKHSRRTVFAKWRSCTLSENGVFAYADGRSGRVVGTVSIVGGSAAMVAANSPDFKLTRANGAVWRLVAKSPADANRWVAHVCRLSKNSVTEDADAPGSPGRTVHGRERTYSDYARAVDRTT